MYSIYLSHLEDVNGDGLLDLVVQIDTTNLDPGQIAQGRVKLAAQTNDGQQLTGSDTITIVPPK